MRGKLLVYFLGLGLITTYVAAPFITAWSIREAIRTGDAAYLEARIDWPRVKETLKTSMSDYALGPGTSVPANAGPAENAAPRPGLWQRIKNAYGRRVVASMVDSMVTPASLTKLLAYRQSFNEKIRGIPDERDTLPLGERIARAWSRVESAQFTSPTRFAMTVRDRVIEDRSYAGILELQGGVWRLVHLEIRRNENPGQALASAAPQRAPAPGARTSLWQAIKQAALP